VPVSSSSSGSGGSAEGAGILAVLLIGGVTVYVTRRKKRSR
jgi:hypothetical protein